MQTVIFFPYWLHISRLFVCEKERAMENLSEVACVQNKENAGHTVGCKIIQGRDCDCFKCNTWEVISSQDVNDISDFEKNNYAICCLKDKIFFILFYASTCKRHLWDLFLALDELDGIKWNH